MATRPAGGTTKDGVGATLGIRGPALTYTGDPFRHGLDRTLRYEPDAIIVVEDGRIVRFGPAADVAPSLPAGTTVDRYGEDTLVMPGFIDCHVHFPQLQIIGAGGEQLLDWLAKYTFAAEERFADPEHAREVARFFLSESLRNGITTSAVYCTVHATSVDALFEEALGLGLRTIAGKVLMDRNAPQALLDTAQAGYDESRALIERWHGRGRLRYAITPRFAATSSPAQLEAAGALRAEHPDAFLQSHVAENRREIEWIRELYPERRHYLDVYDHYGLLGPRAIYGHGIWLSEEELRRCHDTGTAIAHCPTSNFFLGSGCLDLRRMLSGERPLRVGLATDLGAGTSFSMLRTMSEAYKAAQLHGYALRPGHAFYLATRGSAHALYVDDTIGSIAPGMEADLVVLDLRSTPLIEYRMRHAADLEEALGVQMALGDDRAVRATYAGGCKLYDRAA
ncbi:MAG TPA: guanine deaminase [Casimicrobiaceae bacterium]|nr:guanine deaminase [Casimicrobiaceae bacterium]